MFNQIHHILISSEAVSVQNALDKFSSTTYKYSKCAVCETENTPNVMTNFICPKLLIFDLSHIFKRSSLKSIDEEIQISGFKFILFGIIYSRHSDCHYISRFFRSNDILKRKCYHYDGLSTGGKIYEIKCKGPCEPNITLNRNSRYSATVIFYVNQSEISNYATTEISSDMKTYIRENDIEEVSESDPIQTQFDNVLEPVSKLYNVICKATGKISGTSVGAPIFGELTERSMIDIFQTMTDHCNFSNKSYFIDIGSGLGNPVLHSLIHICPKISLGIECDESRFYLSMINLEAVIGAFERFQDTSIPILATFICVDATSISCFVSFLKFVFNYFLINYFLFVIQGTVYAYLFF
jgi:hypothetical protein